MISKYLCCTTFLYWFIEFEVSWVFCSLPILQNQLSHFHFILHIVQKKYSTSGTKHMELDKNMLYTSNVLLTTNNIYLFEILRFKKKNKRESLKTRYLRNLMGCLCQCNESFFSRLTHLEPYTSHSLVHQNRLFLPLPVDHPPVYR